MKIKRISHISYYILIAIIFAFGATLRYSSQHEKIPADCDEFGYLNMAKAMDLGKTFTEHQSRPFLDSLISIFKKNNLNELEYIWMMVPHAYHLSNNTNYKIINQYPPGTSFILSLIPIEYRNISFVFIAILLLFSIPIITIYFLKVPQKNLPIAFVSFFATICIISIPYLTELARVNSLAFTFGLFISAGIFLKKNPIASVFLIALSGNFRVINLLMIIPIILFILPEYLSLLKQKNWKSILTKSGYYLIVFFIGFIPYIYYSTKLLGNPFIPTHPQHDINFIENNGVIKNILFYFSLKQAWFLTHLVLLLILFTFYRLKHLNLSDLLIWISFPFLNYLFFIFHKVQMDYYPFASSLILNGGVIYYLSSFNLSKKWKKILFYFPFTFSIIILIDGINRYTGKEHFTFQESKEKYLVLCNYDIVWGEMYAGTSEYLCSNTIGFKYAFASPEARNITMNFLKKIKYKQVILCDDISINYEDIKNELNAYNILFETKHIENIGKIIVIN